MLSSIAILLLFGWGTAENGLILYSLYFGWAYFVLLFQLVERIGELIHARWFLSAACTATVFLLLAANIPAIQALREFSTSFYPV